MSLQLNINSYATTSGAAAYFADSLRNSNWNSVAIQLKAPSLIEATRYLERLNWKGVKTSSSQPLHFPIDGSTTVPIQIVEATYEIALRLAEDPTLIDSISNQSQAPIKRVKADSVEVEFVTGGVKPATNQLFDWVSLSLKGFLAGSGGGGFSPAGAGFATGTEQSSSFNQSYDRSDGFA